CRGCRTAELCTSVDRCRRPRVGPPVLFWRRRKRQSDFERLSAPELLSLCVAKEKVTKEKGHPGWRLPGVLPGKCVRRGRAFRAGSCPREKASPSMASPAARPCRPRLTAAQGPRKSRR